MVCPRCQADKVEADFWRLRSKPRAVCKGCETSATMRRLYGITLEDYDRMFESQNGVCGVCGAVSKNRLHIDHDHLTGKVRALLCFTCNSVLGKVADDPQHLRSLANYLEDF